MPIKAQTFFFCLFLGLLLMFLFNHFFFLSPAAASSLGSFFPAFSFFYTGFFSAFGAMGTNIRENKTLGEGKAWMTWMLCLASCMHTKESEMMFERKRLREKRLGIGMRGVHGYVIPVEVFLQQRPTRLQVLLQKISLPSCFRPSFLL